MQTLEEVQREGRERLYPSLTNPNWLVLSRRREIFKRWIARLEDRELVVLDVGGRIQPYRPMLEGRIGRYVAIDLRRTPLVHIVARGEAIPFASEKFDLIICTQVLQYVPDPGAVIAEFHRVLRPGGCLLLSAPAAGMQDSGDEYWRFLPAAFRKLLLGFHESEVVPEGGSIVGLFRITNACLDIFMRYPILRTCYRASLCPLLNLLGALLDRIAHSDNSQFSTNYSVWARK